MSVTSAIREGLGLTMREAAPGIPMLTSKDELIVVKDNRGRILLWRQGAYSWGEPFFKNVGGPYTSPEAALDTAKDLGL